MGKLSPRERGSYGLYFWYFSDALLANRKLHAPQNTIVQGVYRNGRLEQLKVTPESRRKDVQIQTS